MKCMAVEGALARQATCVPKIGGLTYELVCIGGGLASEALKLRRSNLAETNMQSPQAAETCLQRQ